MLHEVGEVEVVLQAGQALLGQQQDLPKTLNRDVVLAMSLAYVELSREAMAETPPAVVKSCSLLESALKLLRVSFLIEFFFNLLTICHKLLKRPRKTNNFTFIHSSPSYQHVKCLGLLFLIF